LEVATKHSQTWPEDWAPWWRSENSAG
jgi:hypothetical protein